MDIGCEDSERARESENVYLLRELRRQSSVGIKKIYLANKARIMALAFRLKFAKELSCADVHITAVFLCVVW